MSALMRRPALSLNASQGHFLEASSSLACTPRVQAHSAWQLDLAWCVRACQHPTPNRSMSAGHQAWAAGLVRGLGNGRTCSCTHGSGVGLPVPGDTAGLLQVTLPGTPQQLLHHHNSHLDCLPLAVKEKLQRDEAFDVILVPLCGSLHCLGLPFAQCFVGPCPPGPVLGVFLQGRHGASGVCRCLVLLLAQRPPMLVLCSFQGCRGYAAVASACMLPCSGAAQAQPWRPSQMLGFVLLNSCRDLCDGASSALLSSVSSWGHTSMQWAQDRC